MKYAEFENLETERLLLRQLTMDDLYDYYERIGSDGEVSRYMLWEPHQDIGETLASFEKAFAGYEEGGYYRWVAVRKEDDLLLGTMSLLRLDEKENSCSFAYMFARDSWGQGYATEAMTAVLDFAFEKLEVEKITADHFATNPASGAVMRKLGMHHTGTVKEKYEKHGHKVDAECYEIVRSRGPAMTANEYQRLAMVTLNPDLSKKDVLINGVMGLCGEAGEAIDVVKKHLHQGHELDREKLIKELGDIAWYLAETAYALDVSLEKVFRANIEKLKNRYPEGFDTEKSINR